jgi:aspartyl/glutamyl-tRNA(Asn/Gln) amidotransferase C subunit
MLEIKDIEKLAKLSRIELTEAEKQTYLKDIGAILNYVDQIKGVVAKLDSTDLPTVGKLRNVLRVDDAVNKTGLNSENIIAEFPQKDGDYLKVKKILEN